MTKVQSKVLIDFYADWCSPCIAMEPILNEIEQHFQKELEVVRVDIDENKTLAKNFRIRSVPTLILFDNGEEVWRKSGLLTKRDITEVLQSH
ncbi:MAG TPA: thioredoxin [Flavobacteriaceae bacterium]|nr:thioredoxin [Flavobacteriaceae bacterium]